MTENHNAQVFENLYGSGLTEEKEKKIKSSIGSRAKYLFVFGVTGLVFGGLLFYTSMILKSPKKLDDDYFMSLSGYTRNRRRKNGYIPEDSHGSTFSVGLFSSPATIVAGWYGCAGSLQGDALQSKIKLSRHYVSGYIALILESISTATALALVIKYAKVEGYYVHTMAYLCTILALGVIKIPILISCVRKTRKLFPKFCDFYQRYGKRNYLPPPPVCNQPSTSYASSHLGSQPQTYSQPQPMMMVQTQAGMMMQPQPGMQLQPAVVYPGGVPPPQTYVYNAAPLVGSSTQYGVSSQQLMMPPPPPSDVKPPGYEEAVNNK